MERVEMEMRHKNEAYVNQLRSVGRLPKEVIDLVEADLQFGLTKEQVGLYKDSKLDILHMQQYSKCLRKEYPKEAIQVLTQEELSQQEMEILLEYYDKGIPLGTLTMLLESKPTARYMQKFLKHTLEQVAQNQPDTSGEVNQELLEYVKSQKEEDGVKEQLVQAIQDKEVLLNNQQEKVSQATITIARLRNELEEKEGCIRELRLQIETLTKELREESGKKEETKESVDRQGIDAKERIEPILEEVEVDRRRSNPREPISIERTEKTNSHHMESWFSKLRGKMKKKINVLDLVVAGNLSPDQLEQIKIGMKHELKEEQIVGLIQNNVSSERMAKIIQIAKLLNDRET